MCEPTTLAIMAVAATVAATGVSAYGQVQSGKAENSAMKYNARLAELEAKDVEKRGAAEEADHARKVAQLKSSQRAEMAADGLDLGFGTPLEMFQQTAEWGERDRQTIQDNFVKEAWSKRSEAALYRARGKNAKTAGYMGAGGTILGGASQLLFAGASEGMGGNKPSEAGGGSTSSFINGKYKGGGSW